MSFFDKSVQFSHKKNILEIFCTLTVLVLLTLDLSKFKGQWKIDIGIQMIRKWIRNTSVLLLISALKNQRLDWHILNVWLTTFMMDFSQEMELWSWDTQRESWAGLEALATAFLQVIIPGDTCLWSEDRSPSSSSSWPVLEVRLARLICTLKHRGKRG